MGTITIVIVAVITCAITGVASYLIIRKTTDQRRRTILK